MAKRMNGNPMNYVMNISKTIVGAGTTASKSVTKVTTGGIVSHKK